jgi:hypothetical protein
MTRCFFQSRVQKNIHHHKGCNWLTTRKYYCGTSTKKIRLIIIGFNTPINDDGNEDNDIFAIASRASDAHDAGKGWVGGFGNHHCHPPQMLAIELLLPPLPAMMPRMSSASLTLLLLPLHTTLPKSIAQFSWLLLPSMTYVPRSTPQAISAAGTPAVQIASPIVP